MAAPNMPQAPSMPQAPNDKKEDTSELKIATVPGMGKSSIAPIPPQDLMKKPEPHFIRTKTKERIFITHPDFTIGKSNEHADFTINGNTAVSRVHCKIVQRNGVNYIVDNNSTNGTFLDGDRLTPGKEVLLKNGAVVWMGGEEFIFKLRRED